MIFRALIISTILLVVMLFLLKVIKDRNTVAFRILTYIFAIAIIFYGLLYFSLNNNLESFL